MKEKVCPICGDKFIPHSSRQKYCLVDKEYKCSVCGKSYIHKCGVVQTTCSRSCAAKSIIKEKRICEICGDEFQPTSSSQRCCMKQIIKKCVICGDSFTSTCTFHPQLRSGCTCDNPKCRSEYAHKMSVASYEARGISKKCAICGNEFVPVNNTQKVCTATHYDTCVVCGAQFKIQNIGYYLNGDSRKTCSEQCSHILYSRRASERMNNPETVAKVQAGRKLHMAAMQEKYQQTMIEKYGKPYPYQVPELKRKATTNAKISKFEQRVCALFETYNIEYQQHYILSDGNYTHEFDFYVPRYNLLVDCDGVYYHSYLSDPDGKHVIDDYDEVRIHLVPKDHIFHVIVEGQEEKDIKKLVDIMKSIDVGVFDYESYLFKWCRSLEFPYPDYTRERLVSDYNSLHQYEKLEYSRGCKFGISIVQNYHHSIYNCRVGNYASPVEAWNDDALLKKVITNRLIYKNDVDPSKILKGFNISKICPRVSIFNPVLAKYLTRKYLNDYRSVFDPFSGFSGRLLGVCAAGKQYEGQDLNPSVVRESVQIIRDFNLDGQVVQKDIFDSYGTHDCLLTCPPYGKKEIYNQERIFKSCDDWIRECISRFQCKKYVFVVDTTQDFKDHIVEEIQTSSHFNTTSEYVILIE